MIHAKLTSQELLHLCNHLMSKDGQRTSECPGELQLPEIRCPDARWWQARELGLAVWGRWAGEAPAVYLVFLNPSVSDVYSLQGEYDKEGGRGDVR